LEIVVGPRKIVLVTRLLNISALLRKDVWTAELFISVQRDCPRSAVCSAETNISHHVFPSSESNACLKTVVGGS